MFGGSTYGPMGGQAAAAEQRGQSTGFKDIEGIKDNSQRRKILQEQHALDRAAKLDNLEKAHMATMAQKTLASESGAFTADNFSQLTEKTKSLEKTVKGYEGQQLNQMVNTYLGSDDPDAEVAGLNKNLTPEIRAKMKLNGDLRTMESTSDNDRRMVSAHLAKTDPTYSNAEPAQQKKMVDAAFKSKRYLNADGTVLDVEGFGMATGAQVKMTANQKKAHAKRTDEADYWTDSGTAPETTVAAYSSEPTEVKAGEESSYGEGVPVASETVMGYSSDATPAEITTNDYRQDTVPGSGELVAPEAPAQPSSTANDGNRKGTRSYRNSNQGNLKYGAFAKKHGAIGQDSGGFAIFPDDETGAAAQKALLQGKTYADKDMKAMISRYAPKSDNNDEAAYVAALAGKTGIDPNKKMGDYTEEEMASLQTAMKEHEGWGEGTTTGTYPSQTFAAYRSANDRPYGSEDAPDRTAILHKLAGWSDSRTALGRDLDFIASKMGPDATLAEVGEQYREIKAYGSKGRSAGNLSWQQAITAFDADIDQRVANEEMTPEEGMEEKRRYKSDVLTKQATTGGQAAEQQDTRTVGTQQNVFDNAAVKGIVPQTVIDAASAAEYGLKESAQVKEMKKRMTNNANIAETGYKLANSLEKLHKEGKINKGFIDSIKQMGMQYINEGYLDEAAITKMIDTAGFDTELSAFAADYLRALSGMAASNQERAQTFGRLGANFGTEPGVTVAKLRAFSDVSANSTRQDAEQLATAGFTGTALTGMVRAGYIKTPDQLKSNKVQGEYSKNQKEPDTGGGAQEQIEGGNFPDAKEVTSYEVFKKTPGSKMKGKDGRWIYNNGRGITIGGTD